MAILLLRTKHLHVGPGLAGKILTVLVKRPSTLALLAMSIFYLWVYVRHAPAPAPTEEEELPNPMPSTAQNGKPSPALP